MRFVAMMKTGLSLVALAIATPGIATAQTPAAAAQPAKANIDAARPVVDRIWPLGTCRRMMDGTMSKMMDGMMASMFDMKASDFAAGVDDSGKAAKAVEGKSMGELMQASDPHYRERMKITMDVMFKEMIPLMDKIEPQVRENMTRIYARKYTVPQLQDMGQFFATPSGKAYAEQSMLVFMEPEIMTSMQSFTPDLLKAMPDIMKKVDAATAHLPKPKKDAAMDAAASEAADAAVDAAGDAAAESAWDLSENWAPEYQSAYGSALNRYEAAVDEMDSIRNKATADAKARLDKPKR